MSHHRRSGSGRGGPWTTADTVAIIIVFAVIIGFIIGAAWLIK